MPLNLAVQLFLREVMPSAAALLGICAICAGFGILMLDELRRANGSRSWLGREAGRDMPGEEEERGGVIRRATTASSDVG